MIGRSALNLALNSLAAGREFFSTFEDATKPFLPQIVRCTQRDPDYFKRDWATSVLMLISSGSIICIASGRFEGHSNVQILIMLASLVGVPYSKALL